MSTQVVLKASFLRPLVLRASERSDEELAKRIEAAALKSYDHVENRIADTLMETIKFKLFGIPIADKRYRSIDWWRERFLQTDTVRFGWAFHSYKTPFLHREITHLNGALYADGDFDVHVETDLMERILEWNDLFETNPTEEDNEYIPR